MKNTIIIVFTATVLVGCRKSNPVQPASPPLSLTGHLKLFNSSGPQASNSSGIKVTIMQNQQVQYTDSSGSYMFSNGPPGNYDFRFEYSDYPPIMIPDYKVTYTGDICKIQNPGVATNYDEFGIGPTSTTLCYIDSAKFTNIISWDIFALTRSDAEWFVVTVTPAQTDTASDLSPSNLLLIGKSVDQVEYSRHAYLDPYSESWYVEGALEGLSYVQFQLTINYLESLGFARGDSIYFRAYPLTAPAYYVDSTTGKKVFPSIGKGSNIVGTVIPDTVSSPQMKVPQHLE